MTKISSRQLCFFLACVAPVGKLILLPSRLAYYAGNDLLFPAALHLLLQAGVVFCALLVARRGKTLFALLSERFGRGAARALVTLFAVFLLYAALIPFIEQKLMVQSVFYDTLPSLTAFAPFFVFSAYLCSKPLCSLGRLWDIVGPLAAVSFFGLMLLSLGAADFGALLPAGAEGAKGFFEGTAFTASWFFDGALVLSLAGKLEYRKGLAWKGLLCYLAGSAAVLLLLAVFYGIFSDLAAGQLFAFSKISKYFAGITVLGRVDFVFIFSLALVMAVYCAMPVQACVDLIGDAYGKNKKTLPVFSVTANLLLFLLVVLLNYRFTDVMNIVARTLFWIFPLFSVLLPLTLLPLGRRSRG